MVVATLLEKDLIDQENGLTIVDEIFSTLDQAVVDLRRSRFPSDYILGLHIDIMIKSLASIPD